MSDLRTAMQQSLETLALLVSIEWTPEFTRGEYDSDDPEENMLRDRVLGTMTELRTALAQPEADDTDAIIIQYHEETIKRLEKRIVELELALCQRHFVQTAPAQPEPVAAEQKNHTHEWIHTGSMKGGEYRCVQCGTWGKKK